jgi:2,4-dienoyl-CoA reductase-like NADH-dependent reductase (Old Yellow Enzyme family)
VRVFETASIGSVATANRILRSATFEGLCDGDGKPGPAYQQLYARLASQELGALITGFAYISQDGRAMQPGQAGIESDAHIGLFRRVTESVHAQGSPIFLQLAHAGRQTTATAAGGRVYGPSSKKSRYFNARPQALDGLKIQQIIAGFAEAAGRARQAGFDGVQLHAAHGYLIHQFLHPAINDRADAFGIDPASGIGSAFLDRVIDQVRAVCGTDYPLLVKVSAGDNYRRAPGQEGFIRLIRFLDAKRVDAIEVSFGTMDHAFNIFRGDSIPLKTILDFNPRYGTSNPLARLTYRLLVLPLLKRHFLPFTPRYNLDAARLAKQYTRIPIISVGGFRSGSDIRRAIEEDGVDFVSLCRPLLCEPDFVSRIKQDVHYQSHCTNCNRCAVMCDSGLPTRCHGRRSTEASARAVPGRGVGKVSDKVLGEAPARLPKRAGINPSLL